MALAVLYVLLSLVSLSQLVLHSAQEFKQTQGCSSFRCGTLGEIGFPFSNITNQECGLSLINCSRPEPEVQFRGQQEWHEVVSFNYSTRTIEIKVVRVMTTQFTDSNGFCQVESNFIPPVSPSLSINVTESRPFFKCNKPELHDKSPPKFLLQFQNYTDCKHYDLYYDHPRHCLPPLPESLNNHCRVVVLPPTSLQSCLPDVLKSWWDGIVRMNWHVSPACLNCRRKGGQCLDSPDESFKCENPRKGNNFALQIWIIVDTSTVNDVDRWIAAHALEEWALKLPSQKRTALPEHADLFPYTASEIGFDPELKGKKPQRKIVEMTGTKIAPKKKKTVESAALTVGFGPIIDVDDEVAAPRQAKRGRTDEETLVASKHTVSPPKHHHGSSSGPKNFSVSSVKTSDGKEVLENDSGFKDAALSAAMVKLSLLPRDKEVISKKTLQSVVNNSYNSIYKLGGYVDSLCEDALRKDAVNAGLQSQLTASEAQCAELAQQKGEVSKQLDECNRKIKEVGDLYLAKVAQDALRLEREVQMSANAADYLSLFITTLKPHYKACSVYKTLMDEFIAEHPSSAVEPSIDPDKHHDLICGLLGLVVETPAVEATDEESTEKEPPSDEALAS